MDAHSHALPSLGSRARRPYWKGVWRLADPKITLASAASLFLGATVAAYDGAFAWGWFALTVLGIFFLEAAKNASGEVVDWDSGTDVAVAEADRSPFSGGKRVIVDGLMTRRETALTAVVFYALGVLFGLLIVLLREPQVIWVGLIGIALAFFYHAPPLKLAYRGLGEAAVAVVYGPLIAIGTYLVQHHTVSWNVVLLSIPLGILVGAFLWINEFPDARADAASGKRTLVVRLGTRTAAAVFTVIVATAFGLLILAPLAELPLTVWLGLIGAPFADRAARRLNADPDHTAHIIPAQGWTLLAFVLMSLGVGVGMLLA